MTSEVFINDIDSISKRLSELRTSDTVNSGEELLLTERLSALLGLDSSYDPNENSLNEEELDRLIENVDNHLNDSIANLFDNFVAVGLKSVNDNSLFEGISYRSAEGLDSLSLVNDGYECIQKTDGTYSFIKAEGEIFSFVDFSQNICITINGKYYNKYFRRFFRSNFFNIN